MSGSILLSEVNIDRVKQFQSDNVSKYNALVLETLTTLDFQMVTDSFEVLWSDGEPIIFNEDDGSALFKLSPEGLTCFLSNTSKLAEDQAEESAKIAAFIKQYGNDNIFEFATF